MRNQCRLFLITSFLLGTLAQWQFQSPKYEGEECGYINNEVWTCQKEAECSSLASLNKSGRRVTCSVQGKTTTVCCPRTSIPNRISDSVSEKKCLEYQSNLCSNDMRFSVESSSGGILPPFPGVVPDKRRISPRMRVKLTGKDNTQDINSNEKSPEVGIFGGRKAFPMEHPHSALIGYGTEDKIFWKCTGTLISEQFVLSAAHCIQSSSGPANWVRLGDLDYRDESDDARPQQFEIIERIVHDNYTDPLYYNDLVLFRLDRDVVFDEYVAPACLYSALDNPDGIATATGYGKIETHLTTTHLMKVDLNFIPDDDCKKNLIDKDSLPAGVDVETMICAYTLGKDTCPGDSGGSLTLAERGDSCLAQLVGITSFGLNICDVHQTPAAYVRVARFIPWIESIVWPDNKSIQ